MIRCPVTEDELDALVDAAVADWRTRAAARTARLATLKKWTKVFSAGEEEVGWGEIKNVYRTLQGDKCAYCERDLDGDPELPTLGASEHDVEHFRPKGKTLAWRKRPKYPQQYVDFAKGMGRREGYYWLAFNIWNYCISCKRCNSQLKGNRFPISRRGSSGTPTMTVGDLQETERPLLIYPLGDVDEDPETLLRFHGYTVAAKAVGGHDRQRGIATIAFFLLNAKGVQKHRALWLKLTWTYLEKELSGDTAARAKVDDLLASTKVPHAAAVRAFICLARTDANAAGDIMRGVEELLTGFL